MNADIYNIEGKKVGSVALPERVFGAVFNADLVHQVVLAQANNARVPVAHVKGRGEVRGGGKKPWRQKGTGRARHGSRRSPIWKGGGTTHGPTNERVFAQKTTKKMRSAAFCAALSQKFRDGEVLFLDALALPEPKTKRAVAVLNTLATIDGFERLTTKKRNTALVAFTGDNPDAVRAFGNIGAVALAESRNLSVSDVLAHTYLIFVNPAETLAVLENRVGGTTVKDTAS